MSIIKIIADKHDSDIFHLYYLRENSFRPKHQYMIHMTSIHTDFIGPMFGENIAEEIRAINDFNDFEEMDIDVTAKEVTE